MKIFSLRPEIPRVLDKDIKVLGYSLERDITEEHWDAGDDNHLIDLDLEGEFTEKLLIQIPTSFLNVEPFYSLDRISLRLLRPFHLKAGWKLTFRMRTNYEHRLLIYCVFEPYPTPAKNPTKVRCDSIKNETESKLLVEFPVDTRLISFGCDYSYSITSPAFDWMWGIPQGIKGKMGLRGDLGETWVFTDGEYARLTDWFGSITQNGSKRSIEQIPVRKQEYLYVYLEKTIKEYLPEGVGASNPRFWVLSEYVNLELGENIKRGAVTSRGIPKVKFIKEIK
jgi:hypothetical protein